LSASGAEEGVLEEGEAVSANIKSAAEAIDGATEFLQPEHPQHGAPLPSKSLFIIGPSDVGTALLGLSFAR
jgi:hypothetical protein